MTTTSEDPGADVAAGMMNHGPDAGSVPSEDAEPVLTPRRKKRWRMPDMTAPVVVTDHNEEGSEVRVSLYGKHGRGREMILEREVWDDVKTQFTERWIVLRPNGSGLLYVASGRWTVRHTARVPGEVPVLPLARYVAGAPRGKVVVYRNGNSLDLRRENLEIISRTEQTRRRMEAKRAAREEVRTGDAVTVH